MRFSELANGLIKYRKTLRAQKISSCNCAWPVNDKWLLRSLICQRKDGSSLDNLECLMQRCPDCKDLKKLTSGPGSLCADETRDLVVAASAASAASAAVNPAASAASAAVNPAAVNPAAVNPAAPLSCNGAILERDITTSAAAIFTDTVTRNGPVTPAAAAASAGSDDDSDDEDETALILQEQARARERERVHDRTTAASASTASTPGATLSWATALAEQPSVEVDAEGAKGDAEEVFDFADIFDSDYPFYAAPDAADAAATDAAATAATDAAPTADPMIAVSPSNRSPDLGLTSASGLASTELRASRSSESVVEAVLQPVA